MLVKGKTTQKIEQEFEKEITVPAYFKERSGSNPEYYAICEDESLIKIHDRFISRYPASKYFGPSTEIADIAANAEPIGEGEFLSKFREVMHQMSGAVYPKIKAYVDESI